MVFELFQPHLQRSSLVVFLKHIFFGLSDGDLADFIFLLVVDDQLVLSHDDSLVLFDHLQSFAGLLRTSVIHAVSEVSE